jgi:hypothetical protein
LKGTSMAKTVLVVVTSHGDIDGKPMTGVRAG